MQTQMIRWDSSTFVLKTNVISRSLKPTDLIKAFINKIDLKDENENGIALNASRGEGGVIGERDANINCLPKFCYIFDVFLQ